MYHCRCNIFKDIVQIHQNTHFCKMNLENWKTINLCTKCLKMSIFCYLQSKLKMLGNQLKKLIACTLVCNTVSVHVRKKSSHDIPSLIPISNFFLPKCIKFHEDFLFRTKNILFPFHTLVFVRVVAGTCQKKISLDIFDV